jgi:threonylcarbamoyladenosine tRNA methylthiotransferase MtaB
MPQLPMPVRKARAARLRERGDIARDTYLARFVGRRVRAIMETPTLGRSEEFAPVQFAAPQTIGAIVTAKVSALADGKLIAAAI